MALKAVGTKLVIERVERQEQTQGGIIISNQQDKNPLATIVSIGDQVKVSLEVGDKVAVSWANTAEQKSQGTTYYIIDETAIFAKEL